MEKDQKQYKCFRDLKVWIKSFNTACEIFEITKTFPKEEKYALIDQIRRATRSVSANIAEAWYKRSYPKSFICKLIDASGESGEVEVWLDFSLSHNYLTKEKYDYLLSKYTDIGKMLNSMINNPEKFCH